MSGGKDAALRVLVAVALVASSLAVPATPARATGPVLFDLFDADAQPDDWTNTYLLALLSNYAHIDEVSTDDEQFEATFSGPSASWD